uniref:RNase H type-1 domain-containing protein n=1 Tax=Equus asinus TaxID=9793 RepID=A0A9L0KDQ4_EQUAS
MVPDGPARCSNTTAGPTAIGSSRSRPDLLDCPWEEPDLELFTVGSSFTDQGKRHVGYAVITSQETLEAKALSPGTLAQNSEVIALTWALHPAQGKKVNIYTHSCYAFAVVHAHGAIWKERGLLTTGKKEIKRGPEILELLDAINEPAQIAIIHSSGLQRENLMGPEVCHRAPTTKDYTTGD